MLAASALEGAGSTVGQEVLVTAMATSGRAVPARAGAGRIGQDHRDAGPGRGVDRGAAPTSSGSRRRQQLRPCSREATGMPCETLR